MSYDTKIAQTQQPAFAELYTFQIGNVLTYYTSYAVNVEYKGDTYIAREIKRTELTKEEVLKSEQIRITLPIDANMAQFAANAPIEPILVMIVRVFQDGSGDAEKIFEGEVISVTLAGDATTAEATCESNTDLFRQLIPRVVFMARCNHILFEDGCGLSEMVYRVPAVVTVSGNNLVSATFSGYANGYFTGGEAIAGTDARWITNHVGNTITLQAAFPGSTLKSGDSVVALPGCDGLPGTCLSKFNNLANHLSFPYIPASNPVIWGFTT